MSIAIMQPYVFPYIGYFQLVHAADVFVFYDDVHYINRGWINRNRILVNGKDQMFTIPCKDASQNKLIMDVALLRDDKTTQKLLATLRMAYSKAPHFKTAYPLIESILADSSIATISELAIKSVMAISDHLGLQRTFRVSSEAYDNRELKRADRLIDICHKEAITHYINAAGGREIYTKEYYEAQGVHIDFLISERADYTQLHDTFVPWLSIIDVLMFNSPAHITEQILPAYRLE